MTWRYSSKRADAASARRLLATALTAAVGALAWAGTALAVDGEDQKFVLGNALPKFDPPSRAELDKLPWQESPVRDGLEIMRAYQATLPPAELSVADALALKNDSPQHNRRIIDALGRLAPPDGAGADFSAVNVRNSSAVDINSTNPIMASSVSDGEYNDLTSIMLVTFDKDLGNFAPKDLVKSWRTTPDAMIDRFELRDDLTWSDGRPVTAHDVEFSFQLIMTDHPLLVIPAVRGSGTDKIVCVKAYDDHTVAVFHPEPLATNWTNINFPIIPKHVYERTVVDDPSMRTSPAHRELEDRPVVAGPYELVKRVRGEEYVLRRREAYYLHNGRQVRDKPYFAEIRTKVIEDLNTVLLAVKAGDIHSMELRAEQWDSQTNGPDFYAKNTKATAPEWTEFHFEWNSKSTYFGDKRVRWAMTYAVDYEELLETICRGLYQQCRGTFHPTSWMYPKNPPELVEQDLDKAEELLDEAGWVDSDGDGVRDKEIDGRIVPFEFQLMTSQTETGIQAATLMKECLEQIGVTVNVKPTEFVVMQDKLLKHEFDACLGGWGAGTDPAMQENIYGTGAQRNYGNYSNPEVDRLFDAGLKELDREKRAEIYGKIHLLLWEDQPVTWLFCRNSFFAFNKELRGYNFSCLGPYKYSPGFGSVYRAALP